MTRNLAGGQAWHGALLVALFMLPGAPAASAQTADLSEAFLGAGLIIEHTPDLAGLVETNPVPSDRSGLASTPLSPAPADNPLGCGGNHITSNPADGWFRFREAQEENGCSLALLNVTIPNGATTLSLSFEANRVVDQTSDANLALNFKQQVWLLNDTGNKTREIAYFSPDDGARPVSEPVVIEHDIAADPGFLGATSLTVGFWFDDGGNSVRQVINPVTGQEFSVTIDELRIRWSGMPAEGVALSTTSGPATGGERVETLAASIPISQQAIDARTTVAIRVSNSMSILDVQGPDDAALPGRDIEAGESDGVLTLIIAHEVFAARGPGLYIARFTATAELASSPLLLPVAFVAGVATTGGGAYALVRSHRFHAVSQGANRAVAAGVRNAVWAVAASAVALFGWLAVTGRWRVLRYWPLEPEAVLYIALTAIFAVGFLTLGLRTMSLLGSQLTAERDREAAMRRRVERSNKELEEYAYVASHDLQEPLRVVAGHVQLIEQRYKDVLDDTGREYMAFVVDGTKRMKTMLQALLQLSRIQTEEAPHVSHEAAADVQAAVDALQAAIEEAQASVTWDRLPHVMAHPTYITQVFQNLIGNAIKFRNPDRAPQIHISADERTLPGRVVFAVSDNGIGMPPDQQDRIFQMFQRLHRRGTYDGFGIGLALCTRIIHRHEGSLHVKSDEGEGSTFYFDLALGA